MTSAAAPPLGIGMPPVGMLVPVCSKSRMTMFIATRRLWLTSVSAVALVAVLLAWRNVVSATPVITNVRLATIRTSMMVTPRSSDLSCGIIMYDEM